MKSIQERYNRYLEIKKKNLNIKLTNEREKYALSKEKHLQDMKQEEEQREVKAFKKYESYVSIIIL